jgi:hypothetical protein
MNLSSVKECMSSLKIKKNVEGYDRIPQRILVGAVDVLIYPFSVLFNKIYHKRLLQASG